LAVRCGYLDSDVTNLQRVSLFYQFHPGGARNSLVNAIREEITEYEEMTELGERRKRRFEPSPALHMLARLPFPIVITTNYDRLFESALARANTREGSSKQPLIRIYDPTRDSPPESVPLDPTEQEPILLKLHGDIDRPESIVVTEEDYIVFIQRMSVSHLHPTHDYI
jgi:SIR2-like domain